MEGILGLQRVFLWNAIDLESGVWFAVSMFHTCTARAF